MLIVLWIIVINSCSSWLFIDMLYCMSIYGGFLCSCSFVRHFGSSCVLRTACSPCAQGECVFVMSYDHLVGLGLRQDLCPWGLMFVCLYHYSVPNSRSFIQLQFLFADFPIFKLFGAIAISMKIIIFMPVLFWWPTSIPLFIMKYIYFIPNSYRLIRYSHQSYVHNRGAFILRGIPNIGSLY